MDEGVRINIIVDAETKQSLKLAAVQEGKSITRIVLALVKGWLKKRNVK